MDMSFKVVVIDYGMGNVRSIRNALSHIGKYHVEVTADPRVISQSDCIILPGVGAYPDAMKNLRDRNLIAVLNEQVLDRKKPILGICLGMQLLFTYSMEGGENTGLGWISGNVEYIDLEGDYRVPHVGWNDLQIKQPSVMFEALGTDKNFYFVHSYHAVCSKEYIIASFEYGQEFTAAVQYENIVGMQFHPEKSQQNGMSVLKQFMTWAEIQKNA